MKGYTHMREPGGLAPAHDRMQGPRKRSAAWWLGVTCSPWRLKKVSWATGRTLAASGKVGWRIGAVLRTPDADYRQRYLVLV